MFQLVILASGSKGNCYLIKSDNTKILLDVGISGIKVKKIFEELNLNLEKVDAILASHEHSDHIKGIGPIARSHNIPVFFNKLTYGKCQEKIGKIPAGVNFFNSGDEILLKDIVINTFSCPHDAIDPCNFTFYKKDDLQKRKLVIATDTGYVTNLLMENLKLASTIVIEANYDLQMLHNGSYPWEIKQRIKGKKGHLSNIDAFNLVKEIFHIGLKNVILAHISDENNDYQLLENYFNKLVEAKNSYNLFLAKQNQYIGFIDI